MTLTPQSGITPFPWTRQAAMRCVDCGHQWQDLDAACNQYPVACGSCGGHKTEPEYEADGEPMPVGWHWEAA